MAGANLIFDILANNKASGPIKQVGDDLDAQNKQWSAWKAAGVAASAAVLVGLGKFGVDSVKAYSDAEAAQAGLAFAFEQFPALADTNIAALQALNAEIAKKTGFDDDATASAQASLAQFGLTGSEIAALTPLMADYAAKTGVDMTTAADQLGKAMLGQGRALKGVGIDFVDTGSVAGNLDQVMAGLSENVGGYAEEMGGTAAGKTAILKDQFGELQEMVGEKLLPALTTVTGAGIAAMAWMSEHEGITWGLGITVGALAAAVLLASAYTTIHTAATTASSAAQAAWNATKAIGTSTLFTWIGVKALEFGAWVAGTAATIGATASMVAHGVATGVVRVATVAWTGVQWLLNAALSANPIALVVIAIAALVAAVVWAWNNVDWFRNGLISAWEWIKGVWAGVPDFFAGIGRGISSFFTATWDVIKTVFSWSPLGIIVTNWDSIIGFFKGLPSKVASAASGLFDGLVSAFKAGVNTIIRLWNNFKLEIGGGEIMGMAIPSVTLNTPNIPYLASGGTIERGGWAVVGERGPELAKFPGGTTVFSNEQSFGRGGEGNVEVSLAGLTIYVQNPVTGEYLLGQMSTVADDRLAAASSRARYAGGA